MLSYEAIWPLNIAKKALRDYSFSADPEKSQELSEKVQEAIELAQTIVRDFNEAQNEAFDVGWQDAAKMLRGMDWDTAKLVQQALSPHPFTTDELKGMAPDQWVWINIMSPDLLLRSKGVYTQTVMEDETHDAFFCCDWPWSEHKLHFPYETYGRDWLAYPHRPYPKEDST